MTMTTTPPTATSPDESLPVPGPIEKKKADPRYLALRNFAISISIFNILGYAVLGFEQARDRLRRIRGYRGQLQRVDLAKLMPLAFAVVAVFVLLSVLILGADIVNPINLPQ
jgi:hypothetical protein